ncbi:MAG: NAD/NADP octopine/nopaline dehydrogenase [uncultured bacterium]|nr:MAG: NAD/NADP octopine/nopaline dehydrogenase [uncultured bacterium]
MKIENKISILGCGHGGMALAADLKSKGAQVALWSNPNHADKFNKILAKKNEILLESNHTQKTVKLDLLSYHLSEVVQFGNVLYNCTPMMAHVALFKEVVKSLNKTTQKLFINLSGTFSSIDQWLHTKDRTVFHRLKVFDTSTFPYACRAGNDNNISILGRKSSLTIAPLFPQDIHYLDRLKEPFRPALFNKIQNSFQLGLMGSNAVFHPATVLFNARLIDTGCSFLFYKDGISKRTSLLHEALDNERILLANTMGYELNPGVDDDNKYYGTNFTNNYEFCLHSTVHGKIKSPTTLNHRFITEDVAYGLVPLLALGKLHHIELLNINSVVNIFSTIMGIDYYQHGRNLAGLTQQQIHEFSWLHDTKEYA